VASVTNVATCHRCIVSLICCILAMSVVCRGKTRPTKGNASSSTSSSNCYTSSTITSVRTSAGSLLWLGIVPVVIVSALTLAIFPLVIPPASIALVIEGIRASANVPLVIFDAGNFANIVSCYFSNKNARAYSSNFNCLYASSKLIICNSSSKFSCRKAYNFSFSNRASLQLKHRQLRQ
jgi:hypothetical protein